MAPKKPEGFEKDEKCLCFHGQFLYEAKILDLKQDDPKDKKSPFKYRVHYKGWKNTWDDWVSEDRLRKLTEDNKELASNLFKDLKRAQREEQEAKTAMKKSATATAAKRRSGIGSELGSERSSSVQAAPEKGGRGTKRGRDWELEKEDNFVTRPTIRIPLPDILKSILVDDWENITKSMQLVPLPHVHPVTQILEAYRSFEAEKQRPGSAEADVLEEVLQGVREYFDKSVGRILLYRFEREQWLEVSERMNSATNSNGHATKSVANNVVDDRQNISGKTASDIYGAEHLCRLFVSMPELIAQTNMDSQSVNRLREELAKMTQWLGRHAAQYFVKEYQDPGQEYIERSKGSV